MNLSPAWSIMLNGLTNKKEITKFFNMTIGSLEPEKDYKYAILRKGEPAPIFEPWP